MGEMLSRLEPLYLFNEDDRANDLVSKVNFDPSKNIAALLSQEELGLIEEVWNAPQGPAASGWKSGLLGWLLDTTNGQLSYGQTEYANYFASAKDKNFFSPKVRNTFTAGVGCAVLSADGYFLVQQRTEGLLAGRRLDSSAAGMGVVREGKLDFYFEIKEKLKRELNLSEEEVKNTLVPTGIHGAADYLSSQATWKCEVALSLEELMAKANPKFIGRVHPVGKDDLPDFLIRHYVLPGNEPEKSLIGDAVGVFLRALDVDAREYAIGKMNSDGADICFGVFREGKFEEHL